MSQLIDLVRRIVTGDGAQLENFTMSPEEWRAAAAAAGDPSHVEITLDVEDWIALVAYAISSPPHKPEHGR